MHKSWPQLLNSTLDWARLFKEIAASKSPVKVKATTKSPVAAKAANFRATTRHYGAKCKKDVRCLFSGSSTAKCQQLTTSPYQRKSSAAVFTWNFRFFTSMEQVGDFYPIVAYKGGQSGLDTSFVVRLMNTYIAFTLQAQKDPLIKRMFPD